MVRHQRKLPFLHLTNFIYEYHMSDQELTSVEQLKVGDFVKYVDRDKSGKFNYVGEVIKIQKESGSIPPMFEMLSFEGIMGFTLGGKKKESTTSFPKKEEEPDNSQLYITTVKPKGWAKFKKNPDSRKETPEVVTPVKTKKQLVFALVKENGRKKESSLLKLAKKQIGGSDSQLTTYIRLALAKK